MPNWQICLQQPSLVLAGRSAEIGGRCESGPCRPVPVGGRVRGYSPEVFPQAGGERPGQPLRAAGQHLRERQSRSRTPVMACVNVSSCRRSSSSAAAGSWWRATCLSPSGPPPCHCRSGGPAHGSLVASRSIFKAADRGRVDEESGRYSSGPSGLSRTSSTRPPGTARCASSARRLTISTAAPTL